MILHFHSNMFLSKLQRLDIHKRMIFRIALLIVYIDKARPNVKTNIRLLVRSIYWLWQGLFVHPHLFCLIVYGQAKNWRSPRNSMSCSRDFSLLRKSMWNDIQSTMNFSVPSICMCEFGSADFHLSNRNTNTHALEMDPITSLD